MWAKFKNENEIEEYTKEYVKRNKDVTIKSDDGEDEITTIMMTVANPTDEDMVAAGYKQVVIDDIPEYDEDTEYVTPCYADGENITKSWNICTTEELEEEE